MRGQGDVYSAWGEHMVREAMRQAMRGHVAPRYGMVWYGMDGMVRYGMEQFSMVWYGMAWRGMVWYGGVHTVPGVTGVPHNEHRAGLRAELNGA